MLMSPATSLLSITVAVVGLMTPMSRADDAGLDSRMYHDPELPIPKIVRVYPGNLVPLWLVALGRPEADYQCRAALSVVLAHREGIKGLEAAVDPLLEALARIDSPADENDSASSVQGDTGSSTKFLVRLAIARALIELDARQTVPQLFQLTQGGDRRLRDLIEPALARWGFRPAAAVWLERLRKPDGNSADLLLAIRGLGALREAEAASPLKELIYTEQASGPMRLEAARALGLIQTSGLDSDAQKLNGVTGSTATSAHLAAAWLLRHHQGDEAVRLLQTLGRDAEPAVVFVALERLLELDAKLVLPVMELALASSDAKVRLLGIETAFREATIERLSLLADKMNDEHPSVRLKARQSLHQLAGQSKFREAVIQQGMRILAGGSWRGLEQAAILLTYLDHKPAAQRLVTLLEFERPEVLIAAAWGLRRLDVPETLPAALGHIQGIRKKAADVNSLRVGIKNAWDQQLSHLAQFIGQRRYQPAESALRAFVPRSPEGEILGDKETRAASIWALGLILEGKPEKGLVQQLEQRLNDIPRMMDPGEDPRVRRMSAITLGRMKSKESLKSLRRYFFSSRPTLDPVSPACGWAILQNTGEPLPPPGTMEFPAGIFKNWLRPLPEPKSKS
jgi:HEAT repeat protein